MTKNPNATASSSKDASITVLIVGAGPTGLTLGCELARRGISFRLIEAASGPNPGSRGKGVQPRSLEVFDNLGIAERVIAHGRMAMPMRSIAPNGQVTMSDFPALAQRPDIPYTAGLITPAWRVEAALRAKLEELGGKVAFGAALSSFEQSETGVSAMVVHHAESESVRARWMVGCDGGSSLVRKQAGMAFVGETREEVRMIVADVAVQGLDRDAWHVWRHAEGMVSLCPLPSTDLFQYQAAIAPGQEVALTLANLQAKLNHRSGRTDILLQEPQWSSLWRANIRLVDRYRERAVFLAGDAAHVHSPAGGQGMNTGIQDAHNLGWKLAAVARGASPALLDSYEAERRPVAASVLALSDGLLKQMLKDKGIATRRDESTLQLSINYRGSAFVHDDRPQDAPLRAGDRAPDATHLKTLEGEQRLFDLTRGGRFTLLCFGTPPAVQAPRIGLKILHVVSEPTGPDEVSDTAGQLSHAYGATARTLLLIRPDGYVGVISDAGDASAIARYLADFG